MRKVATKLLVPYNQAYRMLGLSRAVFDRDIRPQLREARVGRRVLYSMKELSSVAERLLSGNNSPAASGSIDGNGGTALCEVKEKSQDCAVGITSGISVRPCESPEEAKSRWQKALANVISIGQSKS